MARNRAARPLDASREELRNEKIEAAWPHLRSAVRRRVLQGEALEDLAGVVTDAAGGQPDEENLTVGVLADNSGSQEWLAMLLGPAPDGCIYVFGALEGVPALYTLGPVFAPELVN